MNDFGNRLNWGSLDYASQSDKQHPRKPWVVSVFTVSVLPKMPPSWRQIRLGCRPSRGALPAALGGRVCSAVVLPGVRGPTVLLRARGAGISGHPLCAGAGTQLSLTISITEGSGNWVHLWSQGYSHLSCVEERRTTGVLSTVSTAVPHTSSFSKY